jgi:hypothetical protein
VSQYGNSDTESPQLLTGGHALRAWTEAGGRAERAPLLWHARLRWHAHWFERFAALSEQRTATQPLPADPLFIVGLWRTGSTLLHTKLSAAIGFSAPLTWQCFRPATFMLERPPKNQSERRPMDQTEVTTLSPQEDEFAALLLGESSLYRAFIDPRRLEELTPLLWAWTLELSGCAAPLSARWESFLKGVIQQRPGTLLVKSPNHTFRLPWLAGRFPSARFLWLSRERDAVATSNRRLWSDMVQRYGLWRIRPAALEMFLNQAFEAHDALIEWARANLRDRVRFLSFEQLVRDPDATVAEVIGELGLVRAGRGA